MEVNLQINMFEDYIRLTAAVDPLFPGNDLLITELGERGFDTFEETSTGIVAYASKSIYSESLIADIQNIKINDVNFSFDIDTVAGENWNATWEANFEPVVVADNCVIRAPFHANNGEIEIDLVIEPQQSFGTGHHQTTRLIARKLLTMELAGKSVMDMGTGTGVLAILAVKRGATSVEGVDIEANAVENAHHNAKLNNIDSVVWEQGDDRNLEGKSFDVLIANINRNVLLSAMPRYSNAVNQSGSLLLSGFFTGDEHILRESAEKYGFVFEDRAQEEDWLVLHFKKLA
jgi:ribosomal protein L11 methyltransferase